MSTIGPSQSRDGESQSGGSSAKPFLLGLLIGIAATCALVYSLPEDTSPRAYATQAWESVFPPPSNEEFLADNARNEGVIQTKSGLQYKVLKAGEGSSPQVTDTTLVKYRGQLRNGTIFDENEQTPMPVSGVVPGFSEALQLMKKGGEYRIWLPSELAYGEASPGPEVPPNSLLIFDVTLLDFISQEQMLELQQQMQQGDQPAGPPLGQ